MEEQRAFAGATVGQRLGFTLVSQPGTAQSSTFDYEPELPVLRRNVTAVRCQVHAPVTI